MLDSYRFGNENFSARSRKSRNCAEAYILYVAQAIPQIDAEIAEKGYSRTVTAYHQQMILSYEKISSTNADQSTSPW